MAEIVIPTKQLSVLDESMDLQDALKAFVYSTDDVLPVLDKTHQIFRGNIYLLDLYKYLAKNPNSTISITQFIKNTNKYVTKKDCLLQTIFQFGNLPYLAVLNEQHHFIGILRHHSFMKLLEKIWSFDHAKYILTIDYENVDRAMYQSNVSIIKNHPSTLRSIRLHVFNECFSNQSSTNSFNFRTENNRKEFK